MAFAVGRGHAVTQQELVARLRAASGSSTADDPVEAGTAAAREAIAGLHGEAPTMIIVYATVSYDLAVLLAAIRAVTGDVPLVGETSTGQFRDGVLVERTSSVAVLAMTSGPYEFGYACVEHLSGRGEAAGQELARAARGTRHTPHATLMIFTDGLVREHQNVVTGMHHVTGAAVPVVGGAAGDDRRLNATYVFFNDRVLIDAAVAVWIGSERPVPVSVGHGWHPIGLPLLVTKTDDTVVAEIGGRPAGDVFAESIRTAGGDDSDGPQPGSFYSKHALGLIEPDGNHLVRAVYIDGDRIRAFTPVPVYSAIQIMSADADELLRTSDSVIRRAVAGRDDASVVLVFSCIARLDILGQRGAEEAATFQSAAGSVPVFGVYTYGEFARTTSVAGYHNATAVAIAL